jgi:molybdate transport system substrate-binding protein
MRIKDVLLIITFVVFSSSAQISPAVAANMKFAFEEISELFTSKTGIKVTPVYGSSGKLVTQIRNGAPFDFFVSADVSFAESLCGSKLAIGKPKVYAYGELVLWSMRPLDPSKEIALFSDTTIQSIALGDLNLTAYGPAAKKYLEKKNLWSKIEKKIVFGENIGKTAQFIASRAADIGFCAKSIVLSNEMKGKGSWVEIDSTLYDPLPQAAVMLEYGEINNKAVAHKLLDFLYSNEAKVVLVKYGYKVP